VTAPGVYDDFPEVDYHEDPSLSSSGARRILPPSCPAKFKWERDNGRPEKRAFDFGHAAHGLVLGVGMDVVVVQKVAKDGTKADADDYKTRSAQEHRDETYAAGKVPLLAHEWALVKDMAGALRAGLDAAQAGDLFVAGTGRSELSLFWHDDRQDVDRRARFDWLSDVTDDRAVIVDYKTTPDAEPRAVASTIRKFGYHQQGAWYVDAAHALGVAEHVGFLLAFQEKTPPYLVTVAEPDQLALRVGRYLNDRALEVYAECAATGTWPGYSDDIVTTSLPAWAISDMEMTA
jgi:hypothetical protein